MKKIATLLLLGFFSFTTHKYYISLTDINYNQNEKALQITTNLFIDDLELTINKEFNIKSNLNRTKELKNIDEYLEKYLKTHLKLKINGLNKNFNYIGKEIDGDIVYFFLEITNVTKLQYIDFQNTLLINDFPSQQNLIKVNNNGKRKSLLLDVDNLKGRISF